MTLLSRQCGSHHSAGSLQFPSSKQGVTTSPHLTKETEDWLHFQLQFPTWPSPILVSKNGLLGALEKGPKWIKHFPVLPALCPTHPGSTGTLVASLNIYLVGRRLGFFPQLLPHLDEFPPVNISFVMLMTPTCPQFDEATGNGWHLANFARQKQPYLWRQDMGKACWSLRLSLSLPQDFFISVSFAKRQLHDIQCLLCLRNLKLRSSTSWAEKVSLPVHKVPPFVSFPSG